MFDFEEKPPSEVPIVVLDTETTGLFPGLGHRIVEIGAIRMEEGKVTAEMSQLLQPGRKMDPRATAVNGISDEDLVGQPTFTQIAGKLNSLLQGALLVAHNASFDAGFLGMEFYIASLSATSGSPKSTGEEMHLANPWLCTLQLARRHFYFDRNNLSHIAHQLGIRMGRAHRALNDVYMTAEILKRMIRELNRHRLESVGDLLHAQGGAIYAPPPPAVVVPEAIAHALATKGQLQILYVGPGGETERIITPHYLGQHGDDVYLIAYCHLRQDQRTFRLDRIFGATPM
jgi:DNA polymerase-3 subunit epsilon